MVTCCDYQHLAAPDHQHAMDWSTPRLLKGQEIVEGAMPSHVVGPYDRAS
jgi:hypothetical protein